MTPIKVLLNSYHSGANAWFAYGEARGYFAEEGLEVTFIPGNGAVKACTIMLEEQYDFGFGDACALIALAASRPHEAPIAVFSVYNRSPSVIGVMADGPIAGPADLEGRRIIGHLSDVALRTFGPFAKATGIDAAKANVEISDAPMLDMLLQMVAGEADGVFGYYSSETALLRQHDPSLPDRLRFLRYPQFVPDLYGSVVMASRAMIETAPETVRAFLRAVTRSLIGAVENQRDTAAAVVARNPKLDAEVEYIRFAGIVNDEILHPEIRTFGIGGMDPERLGRSIASLAETVPLPRRPALSEIYDPDFLPPLSLRQFWPAALSAMKIRMLLNGPFAGPHAFFFLAQERGWLAEKGIDLELVRGNGAAAMVPRIVEEGFDAGYGDINALIGLHARIGKSAPVAVWATFNTNPFTITVRADGPIHHPKDFEGHAIAGGPVDAALKTFGALARAAGVDESKVTIVPSKADMGENVQAMLAGGAHEGVFGFVNTLIASVAPYGIDAARSLRFINYAEFVPDLYANALMVSPALLNDHPEIVTGLVRPFNRGLIATLEDIDAGIEAVHRAAPDMNCEVQKTRLLGTLAGEMANPEGARLGIGEVDDAPAGQVDRADRA